MRNRIIVIFDGILSSGAAIACILLWFVVISVVLEIILRYFTNISTTWAIETAKWSILYICFLSAAWVLKREGHVVMGLLVDRLRPRKRALLNCIMSFVGAMSCLIMAWYSAVTTVDVLQRGLRLVSPLEPLTGVIIIIIPIGLFLIFLQFIRRALGFRKQWKELRTAEDVQREIETEQRWSGI